MHITRLLSLGLLLISAVAGVSCQALKSHYSRQALPELGPPVPMTVRLELAPSIAQATSEYLDSCSRIQLLAVGAAVEDRLIQAAHQTFRAIQLPDNAPAGVTPDMTVRVRMLNPRFTLQTDALYDRAPAELSLDAIAEFVDPSGAVVAERPLQATRKERLQLELTQQRCEYVVDPFVQDTATMLATQFMQEARVLFDPAQKPGATAATTAPSGAATTASPVGAPATLPAGSTLAATQAGAVSFKATLLDENHNSILEGGERLRVRVDVVNTGRQATPDMAVGLSGPPSIIGQFPATTLSTGLLEPGASKSLEFVATMPAALPTQQAQFQVALTNTAGYDMPPPQTLTASVLPTGAAADDVDIPPMAATGATQPNHYLLAIGLGSYRDPHVTARTYAPRDAEMVATYFQSIGGIPRANVRLLQDRHALRPDLEEALLDWLPSKVTQDSVVILYLAGQAAVAANGEISVIPYDGGLGGATRLYSLKDIHSALSKLKAKQVLVMFDGSLLKQGAKAGAPQWSDSTGSIVQLISTTGFGKSLESDSLRHGLFTHALLRGLRGEADADHNGTVTIGEIAGYVTRTVAKAAGQTLKQEQRPQVLPPSSPDTHMNTVLTTISPRP